MSSCRHLYLYDQVFEWINPSAFIYSARSISPESQTDSRFELNPSNLQSMSSSRKPRAVDAKPTKQTTLFDAFEKVRGSENTSPPSSFSPPTDPPPFPVAIPTGTQHMDENLEHVSPHAASSTASTRKPFMVRVGAGYMELDNGSSSPTIKAPISMPVPFPSSGLAMSSSRPSTPNLTQQVNKDNEHHAAIAAENIEILKFLVPTLFTDAEHPPTGYLYDSERFGRIGRRYCPGFTVAPGDNRKGCIVKVIDADAYDVASDMITRAHGSQGTANIPSSEKSPVVLNLANQNTRGGGWRRGAMAQEEELCYRWALYLFSIRSADRITTDRHCMLVSLASTTR